jgi:hypothetical protein
LCDFRIDHWPSGSHAPLPPAGKHSRTGKRQANQENEDQHGYTALCYSSVSSMLMREVRAHP